MYTRLITRVEYKLSKQNNAVEVNFNIYKDDVLMAELAILLLFLEQRWKMSGHTLFYLWRMKCTNL